MPNQPHDIFQDVDPELPKTPVQPSQPVSLPPSYPTPVPRRSLSIRWIWLVTGVILLIVGIGAVVYLTRRSVPANANTQKTTQSPTTNASTPVNSAVVNTPVLQSGPKDSDSDGLSDTEEAQLGTNPNVADTDHDGLSDYDEVKIYHTNPLKPDTDGDGIPDGTEVKMGYNPNGPGRLLDLQAAKQKLNQPSTTNTNTQTP